MKWSAELSFSAFSSTLFHTTVSAAGTVVTLISIGTDLQHWLLLDVWEVWGPSAYGHVTYSLTHKPLARFNTSDRWPSLRVFSNHMFALPHSTGNSSKLFIVEPYRNTSPSQAYETKHSFIFLLTFYILPYTY